MIDTLRSSKIEAQKHKNRPEGGLNGWGRRTRSSQVGLLPNLPEPGPFAQPAIVAGCPESNAPKVASDTGRSLYSRPATLADARVPLVIILGFDFFGF